MHAYQTHTDAQLSALLKSGDEQAFTEIYDRYWDRLYAVAANKLKDFYLAQELVQDIFLSIWKRHAKIDLGDKISHYLAVALKYKIINARLKKNRELQHRQYVQQTGSIADYSTEQQLSFDELSGRLAKLVANLPEKCRMVYKLSREAGYSQKEIAEKMQIAEKTVESHLSRAIKIIRTGLSLLLIYALAYLAILHRFFQ